MLACKVQSLGVVQASLANFVWKQSVAKCQAYSWPAIVTMTKKEVLRYLHQIRRVCRQKSRVLRRRLPDPHHDQLQNRTQACSRKPSAQDRRISELEDRQRGQRQSRRRRRSVGHKDVLADAKRSFVEDGNRTSIPGWYSAPPQPSSDSSEFEKSLLII